MKRPSVRPLGIAVTVGVVASLAGVGAIVSYEGEPTAAAPVTARWVAASTTLTPTSITQSTFTPTSLSPTPLTPTSLTPTSASPPATSASSRVPAATRTASPSSSRPTTSSADARTSKAVKASFAKVQRRLDGPGGVVVFRVGASAKQGPLLEVGDLRTGVAWSTSKVPVTVAALERSSSATTKSRARAAITRSDNAAAEKLWASLGKSATAAKRTQTVIRAAGDSTTKVQSKRVRARFTAFGQTTWALDDQARFAAGLTCRSEAKATVALMRQITPSQAFGVGTIKRKTAYKGGWGPVSGGYLVRQLAVITMPDGRSFGVAIGVRSRDGFTRGTQDLTRIATWLAPRLTELDGGTCPKR